MPYSLDELPGKLQQLKQAYGYKDICQTDKEGTIVYSVSYLQDEGQNFLSGRAEGATRTRDPALFRKKGSVGNRGATELHTLLSEMEMAALDHDTLQLTIQPGVLFHQFTSLQATLENDISLFSFYEFFACR